MGLQESFSKAKKEQVVPFGFRKVVPNRYRNCGKSKVKKGFACFSKKKLTSAQIKGGRAAHYLPKHLRCHEFTSEEARHHALIRWGKIPKGTPFVPKVKGN